MASEKSYVLPDPKNEDGSLAYYISGFIGSIILTLVAFFIATNHLFSGYTMIIVLMELAIVQFVLQLFLFLHFARGKSANWRLLTLTLMIFFVTVIVLGSIWVVSSLNYNMSPKQVQKYMVKQINEGF